MKQNDHRFLQKPRGLWQLCLFLSLFASCFAELSAQQAGGSLSGRVTLSGERNAAAGVIISITELNRTASTDTDGAYFFGNVPAGTYSLLFQYAGCLPAKKSVTITQGQQCVENLALENDSTVVMDTFVVSEMKETQLRALSQQKSSDNIISVLSADDSGRFPDAYVADALGRMPGISLSRNRGEAEGVIIRGAPPSWSSVSIDGVPASSTIDDRNPNLNIIPTSNITAIEVTKAITPDIDADSIGGHVNIVSQGALSAGGRRIRGEVEMRYNELGSKANYAASATFSDVYGKERNLGVVISANNSEVDRAMNNIENTFEVVNGITGYVPTEFLTKAYDISRARSGASARFDYRISAASRIYFSTAVQNMNDKEYRQMVRYKLKDAKVSKNKTLPNPTSSYPTSYTYLSGSNITKGVVDQSLFNQNLDMRLEDNKNSTLLLGARHDFSRVQLDYSGNYAKARETEGPNLYYDYRSASGAARPTIGYDYSDPDKPVFTRLVPGSNALLNGGSMLASTADLNLTSLSDYYTRSGQRNDERYEGQGNATIPFSVGHYPAFIKVGVKYNHRDKDRETERSTAKAGAPTLASLIGNDPINNFDRYAFGYRIDVKKSEAASLGFTDLAPSAKYSHRDNYEVREEISAAYTMGVIDINRLRILGGVRVENTDVFGAGFVGNDTWTKFERVTNSRDYSNAFPSLQFKYKVTDNFILRMAGTTGINRPDFMTARPTAIVNEEDREITISNTRIDPTLAKGFDFMAEYYLKPLGVLSADFFYKDLKNPMFDTTRYGTDSDSFPEYYSGSLAGWQIEEKLNGNKGHMRGVELAWDQAFTFLPGFLNGLGMQNNYTYAESVAQRPAYLSGASYVGPLDGQSRHIINSSLYYEKSGISLRFSWNYQSKYIDESSSNSADEIRWTDARNTFDFSVRYSLTKLITVYGEALNISDSPARRYVGSRLRVYEYENYGRQFVLGVRIDLK
jgi:TonB-dependent receptor